MLRRQMSQPWTSVTLVRAVRSLGDYWEYTLLGWMDYLVVATLFLEEFQISPDPRTRQLSSRFVKNKNSNNPDKSCLKRWCYQPPLGEDKRITYMLCPKHNKAIAWAVRQILGDAKRQSGKGWDSPAS